NMDGSDVKQITDFSSAMPDWSPDGKQLVFQSDHQNEPKDTPDIYMIDISGDNLVELLDDPEIIDYAAKWSPDGESILFVTQRTGKSELFLMDLEGNATQITDSADPVVYGVLSPDGQKVAFQYNSAGRSDLYVMNLDGSDVVRLTTKGINNNPAFSPDGTQIVYSSNQGGFWDLWIINMDGSGLIQLTNDDFWDGSPNW
ncbi:MAG: DPP IV N-terminal domain-containing protein, partial [Anaerolineaceae bacterium]|nr:DPP IV N-terminal domain-containing protein [Anaerolineaceae bacterium]